MSFRTVRRVRARLARDLLGRCTAEGAVTARHATRPGFVYLAIYVVFVNFYECLCQHYHSVFQVFPTGALGPPEQRDALSPTPCTYIRVLLVLDKNCVLAQSCIQRALFVFS